MRDDARFVRVVAIGRSRVLVARSGVVPRGRRLATAAPGIDAPDA